MRIRHARRRLAAGSAIVLAITTASAIITGSLPASAATLNVGYTLEGCRPGTFDQNTITCAVGDYTTGNLGKSWSELDLVPFRVTLDNNGAGTFVVAGDHKNGAGTGTGWDVISVLSLDDPVSVNVAPAPDALGAGPGAGGWGGDGERPSCRRGVPGTIGSAGGHGVHAFGGPARTPRTRPRAP